jgi:hypothetical protein
MTLVFINRIYHLQKHFWLLIYFVVWGIFVIRGLCVSKCGEKSCKQSVEENGKYRAFVKDLGEFEVWVTLLSLYGFLGFISCFDKAMHVHLPFCIVSFSLICLSIILFAERISMMWDNGCRAWSTNSAKKTFDSYVVARLRKVNEELKPQKKIKVLNDLQQIL